MFKAAIKSLLGHKLRLVTTTIAILLGVSFVAASFVLTDSIGSAIKGLFADTTKNIDAVVQTKAAFKGEGGGLLSSNPPIDAGTIARIKSANGVQSAEGNVFGITTIFDKKNKPTSDPQHGGGTVALSYPETKVLNHFTLVSGRTPHGVNEIVVDKALADKQHYVLGTAVKMGLPSATTPIRSFTLVGIAKYDGADTWLGVDFVAMDTDSAARTFLGLNAQGHVIYSNIFVIAKPGVSQSQMADSIRGQLLSNTEVVTGADYGSAQQKSVNGVINVLGKVFLGFSLLAVLISIFLISNTFSIIVAQRSRELALLRALGASKRQVQRSVMLEALVIGVGASILGTLGGIGLAALLKSVFSAVGFPLPKGPTVVQGRVFIFPPLIGILVTLLSAFNAARRAAKMPPVAAMRETTVDESSQSLARRIIGLILLTLGVVLLVVGATSAKVALAGLGGAATLIGVIVAAPVLAPPLGRLVGLLLVRFGVAGRLARENAIRNPKRTASTATALTISLTLVGALTILNSSFIGTINNTFEKRFLGNFEVDTGSFRGGGVSPQMAATIDKLPEVQATSGVRNGEIKVFGDVKPIVFVRPDTIEQIVDVGLQSGTLRNLGLDQIAVNKKIATVNALHVGSIVSVLWANGDTAMTRVVAIYENASSITQNDDPYLMGMASAEKHLPPNTGDLRVLVKTKPGVAESVSRKAIEGAITKTYPQVKVLNRTQVKDAAAANFNQVLNIFLVLLGLSVAIGLLGIVNTMLLSIFERTRELGLLRAVGMKRRQLGSSIAMESVIIALLGASLGMLVGMGLGAAVISSVRKDLNNAQVVVPYGTLVTVFILTVIFGVIAAALPARRAMKLDVLDAIGVE